MTYMSMIGPEQDDVNDVEFLKDIARKHYLGG